MLHRCGVSVVFIRVNHFEIALAKCPEAQTRWSAVGAPLSRTKRKWEANDNILMRRNWSEETYTLRQEPRNLV